MRLVGRQFGEPRGLVGRLVGRAMVRGNAGFNRWVISSVAGAIGGDLTRVVELGSGPGVGLRELLQAFPRAQVWGIDRSPVMISQARRRNLREIQSGRLALIEGDTSALAELAPVDLVVAVHVLYFWHRPATELGRIRAGLRPDGIIAIGYRLREDMPRVSQRQFPAVGHRLYDSDEQVAALLNEAGFQGVQHTLQEPDHGSLGRLVTGKA